MTTPRPLKLIHNQQQLIESLTNWTHGLHLNRETGRSLCRQTSYWVYEPALRTFGPSKFVAFADMDFARYEQAREGHVTGDRFDGNSARRQIEKILGVPFELFPDLEDLLREWAAREVERTVFDRVDARKWKFIRTDRVRGKFGGPPAQAEVEEGTISSVIAADASLVSGQSVKVRHPTCPFCKDDVVPGTGVGCRSCMAWSHADCRREHGGCPACGQ